MWDRIKVRGINPHYILATKYTLIFTSPLKGEEIVFQGNRPLPTRGLVMTNFSG
jgi:hypothetical protein